MQQLYIHQAHDKTSKSIKCEHGMKNSGDKVGVE